MLKSRLLRHGIIGFSIILVMGIVTIALLHYEYQFKQDKQEAIIQAERSVNIVSNHLELTLATVDGVVSRAVEKYYVHKLLGYDVSQLIPSHLNDRVQEVPFVAAILVTDKDRAISWASVNKPYDKKKITSLYSSYTGFLFQQEAVENGGLAVNVLSHNSGKKYIVLTRPLLGEGGHVEGVISAFVDASYFITYFRSISKGEYSNIELFLDEGSVLTASPKKISGLESLYDQVSLHEVGPQQVAVLDLLAENKVGALIAYKRLVNLPLTVMMITDGPHILQSAIMQRNYYIAFISVFVLFAVVIYYALWLISQHIERVKESEELAVTASQAKSEFLARMSHEFRTPLNAIIGFSEVMQQGIYGKISKKQAERVRDIHRCGRHLLGIVNDILEFSKGEANKLSLYESDIAIRACVLRSTSMVKPAARIKQIRLIEKVDKGLPRFRGDEKKLKQILVNLVSNAVKFTHDRGVVIVSARISKERELIIQVKDTGVGMSEQDLPHAMSLFGQVLKEDHLIGHSHEGTGLGLPLCKMFVELHDGTIAMDSIEGVGTTVTLTFPATRCLKRKKRSTKKVATHSA